MQLAVIFFSAMLIDNVVLSRFLGICPFLGVSKKLDTALGMGVAVMFVMTLASAVTFLIYQLVLVNLGITYLYNIAFILIIAALVQFVEMFLKKSIPSLYRALGVYLPLITTNCAVLGVTVINMTEDYSFAACIINAVGTSAGFTLAIVLFAGIRERLADSNIPKAFRGFPIALITAGLMSVAFFGFSGLVSK